MINDPLLVVGATGLLGGMICERASSAQQIKALVRASSRSKADGLASRGTEIVVGDLKDRPSLMAACRGVRTIISTATAIVSQNPTDSIETVDLAGQLALIDAAEGAGVRRFIFVSFPEQPEESPLQSAKRAVERRLRESRLSFTILRPAFFQEVWLSAALGFDAIAGRVRIYGSGEAKMSWMSVEDVADAAVLAASDNATSGLIQMLGGPEALSPNEVVKIFEERAGRPFVVENIPQEALKAQYAAAVDPRERSFFALAIDYSRGRVVPIESASRFAKPKIHVRDYAAKLLGSDRT